MALERESVVIPSAARDLALEVWDILVSSRAQSSFVRVLHFVQDDLRGLFRPCV